MIIGISGSPREENTKFMLETVLEATGKEYEIISLKDKYIEPCTACEGCYETHKCIVDDDMQGLYDKLRLADAIVLGSPTYFSNVTGIMKDFMDRCLPFYLSEELEGKKAAIVAVGNFKKGEVVLKNNMEPTLEQQRDSVKNSVFLMEKFLNHLRIWSEGKVYALEGDAESKKEELIKLGKNLSERI